MLAVSEIGPALLAKSDNGYNIIVGSTAANPDLFSSYADHPRKRVKIALRTGDVIYSTAAGRYQILTRFYDAYRPVLKLTDFGHFAQDSIALHLIGECRATPMITQGRIEEAIDACSSRWASLPGAGYNQHEQKLAFLIDAYVKAGGTVS